MPDRYAAWKVLEDSDPIASASEIEAAIRRLAGEITELLADTYPLVLTVMGGAVLFAGRLLPQLRFPLDLDYVHATRYGAAAFGGAIEWRVAPPLAVPGRTVLLLDDILDAGHTLCAIKNRLLEEGAASVRSAVLVEKSLLDPKPIHADFVGMQVPDRFVFGFGMDAMGFWRNLPEIRAMRKR
jgi:hypoxanthine phosphoribosyltransferase